MMAWFGGWTIGKKKEEHLFECHHRWICANVDEPYCEPASTTKKTCDHFRFKKR